ncbi:MAG: ACT domain-containing protein, partial [Propioniciclava sp.]
MLRVILPDRPGSLGTVASALGDAQADIASVEIIEKGGGLVIDDFMVGLPDGGRPDTLVSACAA